MTYEAMGRSNVTWIRYKENTCDLHMDRRLSTINIIRFVRDNFEKAHKE